MMLLIWKDRLKGYLKGTCELPLIFDSTKFVYLSSESVKIKILMLPGHLFFAHT